VTRRRGCGLALVLLIAGAVLVGAFAHPAAVAPGLVLMIAAVVIGALALLSEGVLDVPPDTGADPGARPPREG
jgi:hypothetical protein